MQYFQTFEQAVFKTILHVFMQRFDVCVFVDYTLKQNSPVYNKKSVAMTMIFFSLSASSAWVSPWFFLPLNNPVVNRSKLDWTFGLWIWSNVNDLCWTLLSRFVPGRLRLRSDVPFFFSERDNKFELASEGQPNEFWLAVFNPSSKLFHSSSSEKEFVLANGNLDSKLPTERKEI